MWPTTRSLEGAVAARRCRPRKLLDHRPRGLSRRFVELVESDHGLVQAHPRADLGPGRRRPAGVQGEAGPPVTVVWLPGRRRPEAARRAGLEGVEKLLIRSSSARTRRSRTPACFCSFTRLLAGRLRG
jgi:hypothetical protein